MNNHPRLTTLIASGVIRIDRGEYVGKASDGTEVSLGVEGDETGTEDYLSGHPTPDTWSPDTW